MMRCRLRISSGAFFFAAVVLLSLVLAYVAPWLFDPQMKGCRAGALLSEAKAHRAKAVSTAPAQRSKPLTVLLLGLDARPSDRTGRADAIVVARYDPEANKLFLLSVPRDTRAEIPRHGVGKVNSAYALGGPALAEETVSRLLGVRVDRYAAFRWDGFVRVVDILGGVELDVERDMRREDASAGDLSEINLRAGHQLLDGRKALQYARWRGDGRGDIGRIERQQKLLEALIRQILRPENLPRLPGVAVELMRCVDTDISAGEALGFLRPLSDVPDIRTATLPGEAMTIGGVSYWVVDAAEAKRFVSRFFEGK